MKLEVEKIKPIIKLALNDDLKDGDITSKITIAENKTARAELILMEKGIVAGLDVAKMVFEEIDPQIKFTNKLYDGVNARKGAVLAEIEGLAHSILAGERVALNFIQRLSGIATTTQKFVNKVAPYIVKILDTRKTTPGLRHVEKYAVSVGGGINHRMSLGDAVLIKDNHIKLSGSIKDAVSLARKKAPPSMIIEVEVTNLDELKQVLEAGANIIMLDNMNNFTMHRAVKLVKEHNQNIPLSEAHIATEASGGVNLRNVRSIARTGVDAISIGAITHSAKPLDISLEII